MPVITSSKSVVSMLSNGVNESKPPGKKNSGMFKHCQTVGHKFRGVGRRGGVSIRCEIIDISQLLRPGICVGEIKFKYTA